MNKLIPLFLDTDFEDTVIPHTCPYREDLFGDHETLCDCDEEQMQTCVAEI